MDKADERALKELERYFLRKKFEPTTIRRWMQIAKEFLIFLEAHGRTVKDIGNTLNDAGKIMKKEKFGISDFIESKIKYDAGFLAYLCRTIRRFYKAWEKNYPLESEDFPKVKKAPKRIMFTTTELLSLIDTAEEAWKERNDYIGFRDYIMILINADTGARRKQIRMLDVEHFNQSKNTLFIPLAKGGRDTTRILSDIVTGPLTQYIEMRKKIKVDCKEETCLQEQCALWNKEYQKCDLIAMFLDHSGKRIRPTAMSERFRELREKAGIDKKGAGFHAPRRGKTLRLKKGKLTEEEINDAMGWKEGSRMSHIYGALDQEEVQKKAHEADQMFKKEEEDV